ncbi:MAG: hypothetical protein ACOC9S_03845 [Planctomycetota bacterium]
MKIHRYVLYCDEAFNSQSALRYHHYYGGALIEEHLQQDVEKRLDEAARSAGLAGEIKWQKVDQRSEDPYMAFAQAFFDELAAGYFKLRVMFLDKYLRPADVIRKSRRDEYFTLYYTFITRAFGLADAPLDQSDVIVLRLFLDQLPDSGPARTRFRDFLQRIDETRKFAQRQIVIPFDGISEINSKAHRLSQGVDLVIGALGFRMNGCHKITREDGKRGKRTKAKDRVSKAIQQRLRQFGVKNIGITTGTYGRPLAIWRDPVRLWKLRPREFALDRRWVKKKAP